MAAIRHLLRHPETAQWSLQGLGMLRAYLGDLGPEVATAYIFNPALTPLEPMSRPKISGVLRKNAILNAFLPVGL